MSFVSAFSESGEESGHGPDSSLTIAYRENIAGATGAEKVRPQFPAMTSGRRLPEVEDAAAADMVGTRRLHGVRPGGVWRGAGGGGVSHHVTHRRGEDWDTRFARAPVREENPFSLGLIWAIFGFAMRLGVVRDIFYPDEPRNQPFLTPNVLTGHCPGAFWDPVEGCLGWTSGTS